MALESVCGLKFSAGHSNLGGFQDGDDAMEPEAALYNSLKFEVPMNYDVIYLNFFHLCRNVFV